jgi:hypothetical protein
VRAVFGANLKKCCFWCELKKCCFWCDLKNAVFGANLKNAVLGANLKKKQTTAIGSTTLKKSTKVFYKEFIKM